MASNESRHVVAGTCVCMNGESLREALQPSAGRSCFLVTDQQVNALHGTATVERLQQLGLKVRWYAVPAGELSKSLEELKRVYAALAQSGLGRDGMVVALGGGVVSDLAGFAAATWMRGIDWLCIPTSMEGMVDACVGGKAAVNLPEGKNLVGAFHSPKWVFIDPAYLRTLPPRDIRAGLAESIKHALLFDEEFLIQHELHAQAILNLDEAILRSLITRNIQIKGNIVQRDPFERDGERILLNFGHTMGHALESATHYTMRHGECVALGMLAECRLAEHRGMIDEAFMERLQSLLRAFELPTRIPGGVHWDAVRKFLHRDKKAQCGTVRFVLLRGIGKPEIVGDVTTEEIRDAFGGMLDHS